PPPDHGHRLCHCRSSERLVRTGPSPAGRGSVVRAACPAAAERPLVPTGWQWTSVLRLALETTGLSRVGARGVGAHAEGAVRKLALFETLRAFPLRPLGGVGAPREEERGESERAHSDEAAE